jgi:transposase
MRYYTGLDISMKETAVCIVDEAGKVIKEGTVPTDPKSISTFIKKTNLAVSKVALESGCLSHWLAKGLQQLNIPAICVDARHIAAVLSTTINKTDKNDARGIANALRCNMYRQVHAKSSHAIARNTLLKARGALVEQRTHLTNTIRGLLKAYGIRLSCSATTNLFFRQVREQIAGLNELEKFSIEKLVSLAETLHKEVKELNKKVSKLVAEDEQAKRLQTVPGIGPITALCFKAEIDNPERFERSRSVGAYLGMTPTQYSSGETQRQGRISKCGSRELRHLLMEAGLVILTRSTRWSRLKAWGMKLMRKHGLKKAALAVGRKLAVIMHRMLITGDEFIYGEPKGNPENTEPKTKKTNSEMVVSL